MEDKIIDNLLGNAENDALKEKDKQRGANYIQCPSCGAVMRYDPLTSSLKCDYCNTYKELDRTKKARNYEYNEDVEKDFENWGDVNVYKCAACGAISELSVYEMSPVCPFCGTGNLIKDKDIKGLKPSGILPFRVDEGGAKLKYADFIKKKIFAPRSLRKNFKVNAMKGIYVPIFNFTSNTHSVYNGRLGEYYYVTVGTGKNRHTVRKVRYYNISGNYPRFFNDLQFEVSSYLTQQELMKMGGFDTENAIEYENGYFAGFSSERYTEGLDNTWGRATELMKKDIKDEIINSYGADVVDYFEMSTDFSERRYQYLLAPIWKCGYFYKQKLYNFFINARNGKTTGKAPVSKLKVLITVLLGLAAAAVIAYFLLR